jgi:hypothetical protein
MPSASPRLRAEAGALALGAVLVLAGVGALAAQRWKTQAKEAAACCRFEGASFGMTVQQIEERFEGASAGTFSFSKEGEKEVLRWNRKASSGPWPETIRFELHDGILTAIRAKLELGGALTDGPPLEESPFSVVARRPLPDGHVDYVALVRDCTRQQGEIAALLASAPDGGVVHC